jgi:prevent-host-death family protein
MKITTLTSRQFNQNAGEAKKYADEGPVFITDRGRPAHVLLNIDAYRKLSGEHESISDLLALDDPDDDVEFPRLRDLARAADLS